MAVMYTVLSTAETGLLKMLYTKITPSSEVVPAGKERKDRGHKKAERMEAKLSTVGENKP